MNRPSFSMFVRDFFSLSSIILVALCWIGRLNLNSNHKKSTSLKHWNCYIYCMSRRFVTIERSKSAHLQILCNCYKQMDLPYLDGHAPTRNGMRRPPQWNVLPTSGVVFPRFSASYSWIFRSMLYNLLFSCNPWNWMITFLLAETSIIFLSLSNAPRGISGCLSGSACLSVGKPWKFFYCGIIDVWWLTAVGQTRTVRTWFYVSLSNSPSLPVLHPAEMTGGSCWSTAPTPSAAKGAVRWNRLWWHDHMSYLPASQHRSPNFHLLSFLSSFPAFFYISPSLPLSVPFQFKYPVQHWCWIRFLTFFFFCVFFSVPWSYPRYVCYPSMSPTYPVISMLPCRAALRLVEN